MKLSIQEKLAYGIADTAQNLVIGMTMSFLLYYYTEIFGLAAAAAGTLFLGVRLADGVVDLLIGVAADRTRTRWGRFRPWLLWSAGPLCVSAVLTFTKPDWGSEAKLVYAWITYLFLMVAFSAFTVPFGALSAVMTDDIHERTSLSGIRFAFAGIGYLIVGSATLPLIKIFKSLGSEPARSFQYTMMVYAVVAFALFLFTFFKTHERILPPARQTRDVMADLTMLQQNCPWMLITSVAVLITCIATLRFGVPLYYFKYYVGNQAGASLYLALIPIWNICGALASAPLSRRLGKRAAFKWGSFLASGSCALIFFLPPDSTIFLQTTNVVASLAIGTISPLIFSMLADTADYGEWKCGRRSEGIIFSGLSFGFKMGIGLGGALTGILLAAFGYAAGEVQPKSAVYGIVLLMSIFPALGYAAVGVLISLYPLDEIRTLGIRSDLNRHR
jgi:GPH family glycoside/pentoside/hexuronide:cation symporter